MIKYMIVYMENKQFMCNNNLYWYMKTTWDNHIIIGRRDGALGRSVISIYDGTLAGLASFSFKIRGVSSANDPLYMND